MVFTLNVKICLAHTIDNRNFNWENLKVVYDIHRKNKIILCNFYLITFKRKHVSLKWRKCGTKERNLAHCKTHLCSTFKTQSSCV